MKNYQLLPAAIGAFFALAAPGHAAAVINGDFETPTLGTGSYAVYSTGQLFGGWTVVGSDVVLVESSYSEAGIAFTSNDGVQSLDLTGIANTGLANGVYQDLATTAGQTYTVMFAVGRAVGGIYTADSTLNFSFDGGALTSFTNSGSTLGSVNWQPFSIDIVATGSTTRLEFFNGTLATNYVGLDSVSVSVAAVPEASSATLGLAGVAGALMIRRRRTA